jgi:hypothetical protein
MQGNLPCCSSIHSLRRALRHYIEGDFFYILFFGIPLLKGGDVDDIEELAYVTHVC